MQIISDYVPIANMAVKVIHMDVILVSFRTRLYRILALYTIAFGILLS